jgi:uncharacterized protein (DUF924 family)
MLVRLILLSTFCLFSSCFADPRIDEILTYWFGDLPNAEHYPEEKSKIWFRGGEEVDQEIRSRFGELVEAAGNHQLDKWKETPRGRLALILLVDQFTRNIYRSTPKAFAFDSIARELTIEGLDEGADQKLFPIERTFFYLPLEHAENLEIQELSLVKFHELANSVPLALSETFKSFAHYAKLHQNIIEKFGRFPHRNVILERESTPEEIEFLKGPNSSF